MPLTPLFHDTRFWYHALIGLCGAVDSIALFQYHTPTIQGKRFFKTWISSKQHKFLCETFGLSLGLKNGKKYSCDLLQKEKEAYRMCSFSYTLL